MTCEEALVLISGHIDRENTPDEEAQLQSHLQSCAMCRQILQAFLDMDSGIAGLTEEPPAGLREDVMAAIRAEAPAKKQKKKRGHWAGVAVAAALILVAGVTQLPVFQPKQQDAAAPMAARSMPAPAASTYSAESPSEYVYSKDVADIVTYDASLVLDAQALADERGADVAVTRELLPEMEVCTCETLEDGSLLYQLESADGAVNLSRIYGVVLYQPAGGATADVSYALLVS